MSVRGWASAALGALALTLVVTACGGDESSAGTKKDPQEAGLEFAQCMRENGVPDFPDPDENGRFTITPESGGRDLGSAASRRAQEKCRHLLARMQPPELSDEEKAEMQDKALEFARCMRKHGIDIPDPDFSRESGGVAVELPKDFNPEDPKFQEAQKACGEILGEPAGGP